MDLGFNQAGTNGVDADALTGDLGCKPMCEGFDGALGGGISEKRTAAAEAGCGR